MRAKTIIPSVIGFSVVGTLLSTGHAARAGLIEYLPLNGTTNAPVGTNGTPVNSPTYGPDQNSVANGAIDFAAGMPVTASSYVSVAGGGGLDNLQTGTIAFWVKWNGTQPASPYGENGAVTARQANGQWSDDLIGLDNSDPSVAHISVKLDSCCGTPLTGASVVGNSTWHFVALTFSNTTNTENLYVDGNLDATTTHAPLVHTNTAIPLTLGAWTGDGASYSNSSMDDFRVYDSALSKAQIQALIPEPASLGLVGIGAAGLLARRRRD